MHNNEIMEIALDDESDEDFEDFMHTHFSDDDALIYWCDIAREGRRIAGMLIEDDANAPPLDSSSTLGAVFSAVAAQTENAVISSFALALGVDRCDLSELIAEWLESGEQRRSDTIGFDGFKQRLNPAKNPAI